VPAPPPALEAARTHHVDTAHKNHGVKDPFVWCSRLFLEEGGKRRGAWSILECVRVRRLGWIRTWRSQPLLTPAVCISLPLLTLALVPRLWTLKPKPSRPSCTLGGCLACLLALALLLLPTLLLAILLGLSLLQVLLAARCFQRAVAFSTPAPHMPETRT